MLFELALGRESLWRLHNLNGYGFRKWRQREQCYDERICRIDKTAADGIKGIMHIRNAHRHQPLQQEHYQAASVSAGLMRNEAKNKLRNHESDESTCVPNTLIDEQASSADTENWEGADKQRTHPRRPSEGRRAEARARREQYEQITNSAFLETISQVGTNQSIRDMSLS